MTRATASIDPRAVVDPAAQIGGGTTIGPYCVVGPEARIGRDNTLDAHVIVDGCVTLGDGNRIFPFAILGLPPQDLKYAGERTQVVIGSRNTIREYSQVHRGTAGGGGVTRIGDDGFFMVSSHIAHDCVIGDRVLFANAATLAGHVDVADEATVGAYSGVHQFCRVGRQAYIGGYSIVTQDAMPYCLTVGNRARCFGLNKIGLKRRGMPRDTIHALDRALRTVFRSGLAREEALARVETESGAVPEVAELVEFIRSSKRGVAPIRRGSAEDE